MATRDAVYTKFGITAEAAQLFETELGTMLLGAQGAAKGWHVEPDPETGLKLLTEIDGHTLGALLKRVKQSVGLDDQLQEKFVSALKARNRLMHGFYERHNFKIETEQGCDEMIADLEALHDELFQAWQIASVMTQIIGEQLRKHAGKAD